MVEFPPGVPEEACAICGEPFDEYDAEIAANYVNLVCSSCDDRAVTTEGEPPEYGNEYLDEDSIVEADDGTPTIRASPDVGDNPVFIDGQKCWRRYRFGGWITRRDDHDCETLEEFFETHRSEW